MKLLQLVDIRIEEASRPLREEVANLKLLLTRFGDSLESLEACTRGGVGLVSTQASLPLDSTDLKSSVVEEEQLYGCFSPCGSPCPSPRPFMSSPSVGEGMDGILAPVLQIASEPHELRGESSAVLPLESGSFEALVVATTPELHKLPGESSVVLPLELGSFEALTVASTSSPPQSLASVVTGEVSADKADALFAAELCGLLASLEAVSPGYGKDIACVLAGEASEDMIRKVEKSLRKVIIRGRSRKRGLARKTSRATCLLKHSVVVRFVDLCILVLQVS
jgi:hypothetical protein